MYLLVYAALGPNLQDPPGIDVWDPAVAPTLPPFSPCLTRPALLHVLAGPRESGTVPEVSVTVNEDPMLQLVASATKLSRSDLIALYVEN